MFQILSTQTYIEQCISAVWFGCFCTYYTGLDYNNSSHLYKILQFLKHFMLLILTINMDRRVQMAPDSQ